MIGEDQAAVAAHQIDPPLLEALRSVETIERLSDFARSPSAGSSTIPWFGRLNQADRDRFLRDLRLLLNEPIDTDEQLDINEVADLLSEFAELAGWRWLPVEWTRKTHPWLFRIDTRNADLRSLQSAPPAVRSAYDALANGFLAATPDDPLQLPERNIKKLAEREIWQIDLPNDYRLRYHVDAIERVVYVVYLGPHPSNAAHGREKSVVARVHRQRNY